MLYLPPGSTKNDRENFKPVPNYLFDYMKNLPKESEYVFYYQQNVFYKKFNNFRKSWKNALLEADIKNFRFHDLRCCATSWMRQNAVSNWEIKSIANWESEKMIGTYDGIESHVASAKVMDIFDNLKEDLLPC